MATAADAVAVADLPAVVGTGIEVARTWSNASATSVRFRRLLDSSNAVGCMRFTFFERVRRSCQYGFLALLEVGFCLALLLSTTGREGGVRLGCVKPVSSLSPSVAGMAGTLHRTQEPSAFFLPAFLPLPPPFPFPFFPLPLGLKGCWKSLGFARQPTVVCLVSPQNSQECARPRGHGEAHPDFFVTLWRKQNFWSVVGHFIMRPSGCFGGGCCGGP